MKNLFKIHPLTYIILLSVLLAGYFNYFLIFSTILIIHDLGHILFLKIFKYNINDITILPFGSLINSNISSNDSTKHILVISASGVIFQLALYPVFYILNMYYINDVSYNIFLNYNKLILLFNLLPIIPLDGSKILLAFLESVFCYKKALKLLNVISIFMLIAFIFLITFKSLNAYLIISFLLYKTFYEITNHKYLFNGFLLNRYLNFRTYPKIKYITNIKNIFKNKYNIINNQRETKVLGSYFNR
ncbi:MAG: hypothetical protein PHF21_01385 [Bacilli bacterium]|nr:hypothetical protein [Bacilli bacterium]